MRARKSRQTILGPCTHIHVYTHIHTHKLVRESALTSGISGNYEGLLVQHSLRIEILPNSGRLSAEIAPNLVKHGSSSTQIDPNRRDPSKFGRSWTNLGRNRPNPADAGPCVAKLGPKSVEVAQI